MRLILEVLPYTSVALIIFMEKSRSIDINRYKCAAHSLFRRKHTCCFHTNKILAGQQRSSHCGFIMQGRLIGVVYIPSITFRHHVLNFTRIKQTHYVGNATWWNIRFNIAKTCYYKNSCHTLVAGVQLGLDYSHWHIFPVSLSLISYSVFDILLTWRRRPEWSTKYVGKSMVRQFDVISCMFCVTSAI